MSTSDVSFSAPEPSKWWNVRVLAAATFALALGESVWLRFAPAYLQALGASAIVVGLWGSLSDLLDASWQYPAGHLTDRLGTKNALLILTTASLGGIALFLVPYWPVVLLGLVLYMAQNAFAQPATFAAIGEALPRETRARAFVLQSALKRVPWLIGFPIGGWLVGERLGRIGGVQAGLALAALATLFALLAQWRFYRAPKEKLQPPPFALHELPSPLRRLLLSDILVRMGESATKVFVVLYVLDVLGFGGLDFGLLLALQVLVALFAYIPAAKVADRGNRKRLVALTFLFFTLFPVALLGARSLPLLALAFAVGGMKEIGEPARKASIVDMAPPEHRGRVVGAYYAVRGFAIAPIGLLAGLLWIWNPAAPFVAGAALSGAGLLLYVATVPAE